MIMHFYTFQYILLHAFHFNHTYFKGSFWPSMSSLWVTFSHYLTRFHVEIKLFLNSRNGHLQLSEVD
jgi:hypothetical protein